MIGNFFGSLRTPTHSFSFYISKPFLLSLMWREISISVLRCNESFIHFSFIAFYFSIDSENLRLWDLCCLRFMMASDSFVYPGHFWQLYTTWRRPATVSIQWWLKLEHCNYILMVSTWIGKRWCDNDTFKYTINTLTFFHRNCQLHLGITMLYLPYLSLGKGRPNWYWALGQEAETITKMNEIKGKTGATNRIVNNVSLRNL